MASLYCVLALFLLLLLANHSSASSPSSNPQIQQAITKCRDKLSQDPTFPKAQHMLGMLLEATGGELVQEEIAELSYQAGTCEDRPLEASSRVDALVRAGKTFVQLGRTDRAIQAYQKALALANDQALVENILHQVTPLFFREEAVLLSTTTTTLDSAMCLSSLASLLTERFPMSSVVLQFQGALARKAGDLEAAYQCYHQATTLASSDSQTESNILAASAAREAGRGLETQLDYLRAARDQADNDANLLGEVWNNMGIAYKAAGQREQAIECFQSALENKPGDGHALAQLASLNHAPQSATAFDADYVQGLFDGYSARFEDELVHTLDYKGHEWVAQQVLDHLDKNANMVVVDLGCGTGLVGQVLVVQHSAKLHLVGVDLSQRMVDIALGRTLDDRKIYQKVQQEDAETFLNGLTQETVGAIVAADVFIYVGELEGIFTSSWKALSSGGLLVFSVELSREGMVLLQSGRFGHSKKYISELAKQTGFNLKLWKEGTLRKQHGAPVQGAVVVLEKKEREK